METKQQEPMTVEKTLKMFKQQVKLWRFHRKVKKANLLADAIKSFEDKSQITFDRLRKDYNEIKVL